MCIYHRKKICTLLKQMKYFCKAPERNLCPRSLCNIATKEQGVTCPFNLPQKRNGTMTV